MDRSNKLHVLLFVAAVGFYTLIILGLVVLGLHVRRDTQVVLKAIETLGDQLAADRRLADRLDPHVRWFLRRAAGRDGAPGLMEFAHSTTARRLAARKS